MTTAKDILKEYSNKVPIIIESDSNIELDKNKYIVPKDITLRQFNCILSRYIKKNEKQSIILFINNTLPIMTDTIGNLYNLNKSDEDNFLYIRLKRENTFG